ncbi:MAG: SEL1-like repeat protein [Dehalococcoidia bacterium]|nr:SEL1-like repeat protein [Dehalococcoidia bacterium]
MCFGRGQGVALDHAEAVRWLRLAAAQRILWVARAPGPAEPAPADAERESMHRMHGRRTLDGGHRVQPPSTSALRVHRDSPRQIQRRAPSTRVQDVHKAGHAEGLLLAYTQGKNCGRH